MTHEQEAHLREIAQALREIRHYGRKAASHAFHLPNDYEGKADGRNQIDEIVRLTDAISENLGIVTI